MTAEGVRVLLLRSVYAVALIAGIGYGYLVLQAAAANGTLGYDFKAYDLAATNLLAGRTMYDHSATSMGAFGLFFYPPPFALLVAPFALLPEGLDILVWTAVLISATVIAIWILPVSGWARLIVGLLAAFSWPLVFAIKLGQVGPILLLLLSIGWRSLARPGPFGVAMGLGTIIKLQPALVVVWAFLTGRRRAAVIAVGVAAVLALAGTVVAGQQSWFDMAAVLGRVSRPVLAENDMGIGRLAYLAGASLDVATVLHYANVVLVLIVAGYAVWRLPTVASYLVVVTASQFVSPVLWDHYALVLLLPVAWLIERRQWWAGLIPLAAATILAGITPPIYYPLAFWVVLLALLVEGRRDRLAPAAA